LTVCFSATDISSGQLDVVSLLGVAKLAVQQRHDAATISTVAMILIVFISSPFGKIPELQARRSTRPDTKKTKD